MSSDLRSRYQILLVYQKLLTTAYIQTGAASSSFIQSYSKLAETFNISIDLDKKNWI